MAAVYKLRCNVVGHKKDVRALAPAFIPDGGIVSGSRDCTTSIWLPNDHDAGFTQGQVLEGHSNFVASVCVLPPDDNHPQGLIVTGSNDSTILMFAPGQLEPVAKLTEHTGTVCALASGKFGFLLSGSWDKTAKVWLNKKCVMTLTGHEAAVWAVAVISQKGAMLTGSADKTIKMWKAGKLECTFKGHEDCVRGLVVVNENSFMSCSNDATVRRWMLSGDCVNVYYGHTNYVYSLALLPNGTDFVTSGEDRTVRVWKDGECVQTIPHPTESVWCVAALANEDIVTGSSDGVMRVFTKDPARMASAEDQKALEDLVASSTIPTQLGDINTEDLPGPEALNNPGQKEGQSKMVRRGEQVELYTWDQAQQKWTKVGDIVGAVNKDGQQGGNEFEGKTYDYVFSVDIEEGKPPLKLPYNVTEDPWHAAQAFLHRNNLSQLFLDQVANFIVSNAKGVSLTSQTGSSADPFTGANRYMPSSAGSGDTTQVSGGGGADPFTGASSYQPSAGVPKPSVGGVGGADPFTGADSYRLGDNKPVNAASNPYFPVSSYLFMEAGNPQQIIGKLLEFNKGMSADKQVAEASVRSVEQVLSGQPTEASLVTLQQLLDWPEDKLFPVLDVLRMGVLHAAVARAFCQQPFFVPFLVKTLSSGSPTANVMLVLRTVGNLFRQPEGIRLMDENQSQLLQVIAGCNVKDKKPQIAQGTAVLNFSVAAVTKKDVNSKSECISAICQLLKNGVDDEGAFRLLVALGTLIHHDEMCLGVLHSLDITSDLQRLRDKSGLSKVVECAKLILKS